MSSSSPPKRTSAVDIPLILDLICQDLTRHHLLACVRVCHSWRDAFQLQLDRFVRLDKNPKTNQEHTRAVVKRAGRIRSLQVDIADGGWFLDNHIDLKTSTLAATPNNSITVAAFTPAGRCINLEELSCIDFDYLPRPSNGDEGWFYHAYDRPSIISQSSNALHLIRQNPKLRSLHIRHARQFYRTDHFSPDILESLSTHKSLTHIKIHLDYAVDAEFRIQLLQHLPATIQDFELVCRPAQVASAPLATTHQHANSDASIPLSLKRLCLLSEIPQNICKSSLSSPQSSYWDRETFSKENFSEFRYNYPDWLIIPLIQSSPSLEKLAIAGYHGYPNTLMQTLVEYCPRLETIHLGGTNSTTFRPTMRLPRDLPFFQDDEGIVEQDRTPLRGMFPKLKEFRTTGFSNSSWSDHGHEDVSGLLARSTETLETVFIQSEDWDWARAAPFQAGLRDSGQSWADCRQLKELIIEPVSRMDFSSLDPTSTSTTFTDNNDADGSATITTITNHINTDFQNLKYLRLASLADAHRNDCSKSFDYSRSAFVEPTLDDYLQQPFYKYRDIHLQQQRAHRLQFIRHVRELFGRLKQLEKAIGLEKVELEWSELCVVVKAMTEETVLELLKETEIDQACENKGEEDAGARLSEKGRSQEGWHGPMTLNDLTWLGLQWPTHAEIQARQEQRECSLKK